jgi:hypothetical protein
MTLITFQDGQVVLRDGAVGTEQACCCGQGGECCCSGSTAITRDEFGNVILDDDVCLLIEEQPCDGETIEKPVAPQTCTGATAVIEWCDLTVTLECNVTDTVQIDGREEFGAPPLCTAGEIEITRQYIEAFFSSSINNRWPNRSDCDFGCGVSCNRCQIRFAFVVFETARLAEEKLRYYYVTQRNGCDAAPIIETVIDDGGYCCPEAPDVTITFAP